jgi:hypothetical protein
MNIKHGKLNKVCKKCGAVFSRSIWVDGHRKDMSGRVYCLKCSGLGTNNSYHLNKHQIIDGIEHKLCRRCQVFKPIATDFHIPTAGSCKQCANLTMAEKRKQRRDRIVQYKGNKCHDCHGVFPASIYDFHHRDPHIKEFNVHRYHKWEKLQPELDKCDLLCPTCHRLRHLKMEGQ